MSHEPPKILRIKRKRNQDPLQALVLEERRSSKRSKPSSPVSSKVVSPASSPTESKNVYFALTGTDDATNFDDSVTQSILSEPAGKSTGKRSFFLPKRQTEEDTVIPHELSDMVSSFLTFDQPKTPQRKRRGRPAVKEVEEPAQEPEKEVESEEEATDYVYDVYQISSVPLTTQNHPQSQIGYIRFFEDDLLYQSDEDDDPTRSLYSDNEDSNAESFYQNDYPSDEDAGVLSETFSVSEEDSEEEEDIGPVIVQNPDDAEGVAYLLSEDPLVANNDDNEFDGLYEDFYNDENDGDDIDFLPEDEEFERQHFFPGEEDDELATHRDKIFGKLQNMINEA